MLMEKWKTFKFNFDTDKTKKIRQAIDTRAVFATATENSVRVKNINNKNTREKIWAYDAIYASLDRIEDTLKYINSMELGTEE